MLIGVDEVGRGSWAGPVVVAAVSMDNYLIDGLTDSKLLTRKKREYYSTLIRQNAKQVGIGWVSAKIIDNIGLSDALKLATSIAVSQLQIEPTDQITIDGTLNFLCATEYQDQVTLMKKADLLIPSVSAASVVAKVARDSYMHQCDDVFPGFGFSSHVGYGVKRHRKAIETLGPTPIHRLSILPLRKYALYSNSPARRSEGDHSDANSSSVSVGAKAERKACEFLTGLGFKIIHQNWKTRWCEIDIVAEKGGKLYFVEVKYRRRSDQGGGLAAITFTKLRQMKFAAELWLQKYGKKDASLAAIEISHEDYRVTNFVETIIV